MSYAYWNQFVAAWFCEAKKNYHGWTDPDKTSLHNDLSKLNLSSSFIPEPWWGNDGSCPLHSVVINYNLGRAGSHQKNGRVGKVSSYGNGIVRSAAFNKTNDWHRKNRALPILKSLSRQGIIKSPFGIENHLSIELIPWHIQKTDKSYWDYVEANLTAIYKNVISFAAHEASRIQNCKFKNVVLLRMSGTNTLKLLSILGQNPRQAVVRSGKTVSGDTMFIEFGFPQWESIRFISVWGRRIRNGMPSAMEMDELLYLI